MRPFNRGDRLRNVTLMKHYFVFVSLPTDGYRDRLMKVDHVIRST